MITGLKDPDDDDEYDGCKFLLHSYRLLNRAEKRRTDNTRDERREEGREGKKKNFFQDNKRMKGMKREEKEQ